MRTKEISNMMLSYGFSLIRVKKHNIWKNELGKIIVASNSPSCPYTFIKLKRRAEKLSARI